jgi:pyruvate dehydrogenase complex dehydrogenase (E1) component
MLNKNGNKRSQHTKEILRVHFNKIDFAQRQVEDGDKVFVRTHQRAGIFHDAGIFRVFLVIGVCF